jgi:hypothetical protein
MPQLRVSISLKAPNTTTTLADGTFSIEAKLLPSHLSFNMHTTLKKLKLLNYLPIKPLKIISYGEEKVLF